MKKAIDLTYFFLLFSLVFVSLALLGSNKASAVPVTANCVAVTTSSISGTTTTYTITCTGSHDTTNTCSNIASSSITDPAKDTDNTTAKCNATQYTYVSDANNNAFVTTICNALKIVTGNGGKAFAAFAIISIGIGFFTGKVSWGLMIGCAAGIAALFGAPAIVAAITGNASYDCSGS